MTINAKFDLMFLAVIISGIPLIFIDGFTIMNEFNLIVLLVISIALGLRIRMYWPNTIPIYRDAPMSLWNWFGTALVTFIAILLVLGLILSVLTNDYTELGLIIMCLAICANLRFIIPDWFVAVKSTKIRLS